MAVNISYDKWVCEQVCPPVAIGRERPERVSKLRMAVTKVIMGVFSAVQP